VIDQLLALLLGEAERHAAFRSEAGEQAQDRVHALLGVDFVEALFDLCIVMQGFGTHLLRVAHEACGQLLDAGGVGSREQQGLPLGRCLADDVGDGVVEAHVQHAIGFIEHQGVQPVEFQRAFPQMFLDPARRADDDVRAMLQRSDLRSDGDAAAQREDLDVVRRARQPPQLLGDLVGQLARRAQDQRLAAEITRIERVEQGDAECGGLSTAGLGLSDQVVAFEHDRQALRLDRRHRRVAEGFEVRQHGGRKGQRRKSGTGHGKSLRTGNGLQSIRPTLHAPVGGHRDGCTPAR